MPAPAAAAAVAWRSRRPLAWALAGALGLCTLFMLAAFGPRSSPEAQPGGFDPSAAANAEIPGPVLELYVAAGAKYGIDWAVIAAIGKVETNHGRANLPGVRAPTTNFHGCCAGPMQFCVIDGCPQVGSQTLTIAQAQAGTWRAMGVDGDRDGRKNPWALADAIPAAARYLKASGAPTDWQRAIYAYNHDPIYVANVLAIAERYRGTPREQLTGGANGGPNGGPVDSATVREILRNPRITLTAGQRADLQRPGIDARLIAILAWAGQRHTIIVTSLRDDHSPGSNHEAGRAADIGAVDGERCAERWGAPPRRASKCGKLVAELAAIQGRMRSTELIWCWDPNRDPADWEMFARADHCDHIHVGWDG